MQINLEDIAYYLTSSQTKPNRIMREQILSFFQDKDIKNVLDYGCGRFLRDSLFLANSEIKVDAVDLEEQIKRIDSEKFKHKYINSISPNIPNTNYDTALLNFVIQVLPLEEQRNKILKKVYSVIKEKGYLVLSVRNQRDIKHSVQNTGIPYNHGFLMRKGNKYTFVRGYEREEIEDILNSLDLHILQIHRTCDSYITLSQK